MALRKYFKRKSDELESDSSNNELPQQVLQGETTSLSTQKDVAQEPQRKKQCVELPVSQKKKLYKAKLSYKKDWKTKYPWVCCNDPSEGMFCGTCQKWGRCPAVSRGEWTTRGITNWNHATELLKQHADSQWHRDAAATAAMTEQSREGKSS